MLVIIHSMNNQSPSATDNKKERNPADFPLLGALSLGPAHGYDLCTELRERLGEIWTLRASHIYALLTGLEKDGLVSHERIDQENRPAKKVFRITHEGRKLFSIWMASPVSNVRDMRLEFFAKLYFARLESRGVADKLIDDQLKVCRKNVRRLMAQIQTCNVEAERSILDYRLSMLKATAGWLRTARQANPPWPRERNQLDISIDTHKWASEIVSKDATNNRVE
jgi:PadR family transcriptional regulator, regulatory protein AphA